MTNKDIAFVVAEDWMMLYIDGELVYNHHSIEPEQMLDILGIQYRYIGITRDALDNAMWDRANDAKLPLNDVREFFNAYKEYGQDL